MTFFAHNLLNNNSVIDFKTLDWTVLNIDSLAIEGTIHEFNKT